MNGHRHPGRRWWRPTFRAALETYGGTLRGPFEIINHPSAWVLFRVSFGEDTRLIGLTCVSCGRVREWLDFLSSASTEEALASWANHPDLCAACIRQGRQHVRPLKLVESVKVRSTE